MEALVWRIRTAVLWVFLAVGMSAIGVVGLVSPGMLEDVLEGRIEDEEITAGMLMLFALFWLVPLTMAFLTLALRDPVNRWTNAVVGVVVTGMWAWDLIEHLRGGEEFSGGPLVLVALVLAGLTLLWHVWKWPKVHYEKQLVEERISAGTAQTVH